MFIYIYIYIYITTTTTITITIIITIIKINKSLPCFYWQSILICNRKTINREEKISLGFLKEERKKKKNKKNKKK